MTDLLLSTNCSPTRHGPSIRHLECAERDECECPCHIDRSSWLADVRRGHAVLVPKGTPIIYTTHSDNLAVTGASRRVIVHHLDRYEVMYDRLWWAGPGGYWRVVEVTPALVAANS